MAIPIKRFGQYVLLQVHGKDGNLVFETDSLKIDFDIRNIAGWARAKVTVTNLSPETIKKLSSGDNYVTIQTSLHDSQLTTIASKFFVSNAMEEIQVPESLFSMYCYSIIRKDNLEKQIDTTLINKNFRDTIRILAGEAEFFGNVEFKHFPDEVLYHIPVNPTAMYEGSLLSVLETLGAEYSFNIYTEGSSLLCMYKPTDDNVSSTDLYSKEAEILLATSNMRSNPKIGVANLSVVSNLDPRIKPASILDISNLLTLGTNESQDALEVTKDYLSKKVAGFSKYQTLSVQHRGSNWTGDWITQATATSPKRGTKMPTDKWWS